MNDQTVILAGRGPSVYGFDFPPDVPVIAISSAIFACGGLPTLGCFAALDTPQHFLAPQSQADIAWGNDARANHWPFWSAAWLPKHVSDTACKTGYIRPQIPYEVLERMGTVERECLNEISKEDPMFSGWQPGWMDYPNVTGWEVIPQDPPNFTEDGPIGLWSQAAADAGYDAVRHSMLFGIQLAARLGYRRLMFIGCDLHGDRFPVQRATMREWWPQARDAGMEWANLSPTSALAEFLPSAEEVAA
jgi:hypothetical protein